MTNKQLAALVDDLADVVDQADPRHRMVSQKEEDKKKIRVILKKHRIGK